MTLLRHNLSFTGVIVAFLLTFASCEDTFGIESVFKKQDSSSFQGQAILMDAIQSRLQIIDLSIYDHACHIQFAGNKTAVIYCDYYPLITANDYDTWSVNGEGSGVPIRYNNDGSIILPTLTTLDGYWFLDSTKTSISVNTPVAVDNITSTINLSGLLLFKDKLYIYQSTGDVSTLPVIHTRFYRVPDYWLKHLVEKEIEAESALSEAEGDCASFVFFTDTHWGKNIRRSPALIRHIVDYTPISDVLFGGDVVTTHSADLVTPMELGLDFQASFGFLGTHFHCLYGNHDNNSDSQPRRTECHLSDEQVYFWLQRQMTDVVYGDFFNFYYDNPIAKTRIICLDTGRYYYSYFRNKLPATVAFAIEALSTLPNGWHAVMASHIWYTLKKQSDGTYKHNLEAYIKSILKVFDDYNARSSGTYRYGGTSLSYDFSQAGGRIEFCIGGHTHANFTSASEGGIPVIIVISDSFDNPEEGTTNEQSVTLVVADFNHRKVNLFVVGRGNDRCICL